MRLWTLQAWIVAALALAGWGVAHLPRLTLPQQTEAMCAQHADELARGICAELRNEGA